jgi:Protein of unknown function (DUF1353)
VNASVTGRPGRFDRVDRVKAASGTPALQGDEDLWILGDALDFTVDGRPHCVPVGFTTDGASIPRLGQFLTASRWSDPQRWPALAHGWLYTDAQVAKPYADLALHAMLASEGAHWWTRTVLFFSTRWFAGATWTAETTAGPMIYDKEP